MVTEKNSENIKVNDKVLQRYVYKVWLYIQGIRFINRCDVQGGGGGVTSAANAYGHANTIDGIWRVIPIPIKMIS